MLVDPADIEWDDANREHATRHGVTAEEITEALVNDPEVHRNRKGRAGDYFALVPPTVAAGSSWWSPGTLDGEPCVRLPHGNSDE